MWPITYPQIWQILTAYVDTILPQAKRQQSLKETYNFDCQCRLCANHSSDVDPRESMWCPKSCGGTCLVPSEGQCGLFHNQMWVILPFIREPLHSLPTLQIRSLVNRCGLGCTPRRAGRAQQGDFTSVKRSVFSLAVAKY
jgi:hypothetical protein